MKKQRGYIALMTVLIISLVLVGIAATTSLLGIGEGQAALAVEKGEDALTFVEGCTEDALLKARADNGYTGGTITRPEGTCTVTVTKVGTTWTLTVSTTATVFKRTIQVVINRAATGITLQTWQEI